MHKINLIFILCFNLFLYEYVESLTNKMCGGKDCSLFFEDYLKKYQIQVPDEKTKIIYKKQFFKNIRKIMEFNDKPGNTYEKGINRFTHLPYSNISSENLGFVPPGRFIISAPTYKHPASICDLQSFDWRTKGAVTAVKDQGNCASCYAFAAVGAIEGLMWIKHKNNVSLSEQYGMECIFDFWKPKGNACNGGLPSYIFYLAAINKGLPSEKEVPYLGVDRNQCPAGVDIKKEAGITSYRTLSLYEESEIACMLAALGPMSVAIYVSQSLIDYKKGIFNDLQNCPSNVDPLHAVLLVGFGVDPETKLEYFIMKNSWGSDWGEDGYFRVRKGVNMCNLRCLPQQPF